MAPDGFYPNTGTVTVSNSSDSTGGFIHYYPTASHSTYEVPPVDRKQAHKLDMRGVVSTHRRAPQRRVSRPRQSRQQSVWKPQNF